MRCALATTADSDMVFEINGTRFATLDEFYQEISRVLVPGMTWGRNLDAFDDILRGGSGTPNEGFEIRWRNHALSRERLGHEETARQLEIKLQRCHRSSRGEIQRELEDALAGRGPTVFDWLVEIIRIHGPGGRESEDGVVLVLE
jgi:RNAse (barnase) inhibitor barstar